MAEATYSNGSEKMCVGGWSIWRERKRLLTNKINPLKTGAVMLPSIAKTRSDLVFKSETKNFMLHKILVIVTGHKLLE